MRAAGYFLFGAAMWLLACGAARGEAMGSGTHRFVSFDSVAPAGLTLLHCWNAMGMDAQDRVYIGFTSRRPNGREDFAVFRYDPATGERLFLGTFMEVSQAAGNLHPGEEIPKGHTRLLEIDGTIYMGSQGFHDFKAGIGALPTHRGAHLYAYDIARGTLEDVSRTLPGGVVVPHQGIIALSHLPSENLLVALTHPLGDIVLFDHRKNEVRSVIPGIPWTFGNPVSREVVATGTGQIYTYRGTEEMAHRDRVHGVWVHDPGTKRSTPTPHTMTGGFWNGQTWTRDGRTVFLSTVNGELYRLDVASGAFTHLGHFLPKEDYEAGLRVDYLYGITLSADERKIYGIPGLRGGNGSALYAYDLSSGKVAFEQAVEPAVYTGSHMRDSRGRLYFGKFGSATTQEGDVRLLVVQPPHS